MSVSFGFYNSKNGDRKYDAVQMSSIFDGIIMDGVLAHVGNAFKVEASGNDMNVKIGTGRAWFNHTWTLNDSTMSLPISQSELVLTRIDAVVIEVDAGNRTNSIKIIKGTPASNNPAKPTMYKGTDKWQYPLAYVTVNAGVTTISGGNIQNMVGKSECPYVTAPLDKISIDQLVEQWENQWHDFIDAKIVEINAGTKNFSSSLDRFKQNAQNEYDDYAEQIKLFENDVELLYQVYQEKVNDFESQQGAEFTTWFEQIKGQLSEDAAGHLQNQMVDLYSALQETKEIDIVVPTSAWKSSGSFEVNATVSVPSAKQNGQVAMAWVEDSMDDAFSVARIAGLSEVCYTGDGDITFYAARVPTKELGFHVCLLRTGDIPKRLLFRKEEKGLLFDYYSDGDIRPAGEMTPDPSIVTFENVTVADNADVSLDSRGNSKLTMQVASISGGSKAVEMKWTGNDTTTGFPAVRIRLNAPTTELALGLAINCRRSRNMALSLSLYAIGQSLGTLVKDFGSYSITPPNDGITHHIRVPLTLFGIKEKITLPESATHLCLRITWSNNQTVDTANDRVWIDNVGFFDSE